MTETVNSYPTKPRVFILTDITNEPDDSQSFCRYLTYSNQFDTEGVVPTTSTWLRHRVAPEGVHDIIDGYAQVVDNLNAHVHPSNPYPSPESLRSIVKAGSPVYGMEAVGDDIPLSEGSELLLQRLEADDPRPLWVIVWGGTNVLASVLHRIRNKPQAADIRSKLRVYTISDQDDSGAWIRQQWPEIFYICSVHGWNQYYSAAWIGISGDVPEDRGGADRSMVTPEWIKKNFQIGPLGAKYPDVMYAMEGDTPTFLYLIQNGLGNPEEPSWGSWGGRYTPVNVSHRGTPSRGHFADCGDEVIGLNGQKFANSRATVWRWRNTFQSDFAARMQWTLTSDFSKVNHAPVIEVNGEKGLGPTFIDVNAGSSITFDASNTYDPDGDDLTFKWWQYKEPSAVQTGHSWEVTVLDLKVTESGMKLDVEIPEAEKTCAVVRSTPPRLMKRGPPLHIILEVSDNGAPQLTSYRRIVITPINDRAGEDEL
ncbi:DUF1593-domain-containing protein [Aaosphaeria arxii CBS 175.79]|uniref:DUF1593-domain-containing protein n=1 Tax=Aaosphaeria arxii CBS 175.79 TaxID=1450172 RepID=A0A6A5XCG4_9PLEO|nr:DUF1593-domain-containing protein [Aaosphaeria arxii CBS 175.79]KAF2010682.1 DUF1593-domain-containing protein [Aaosphaeria arxii CBS 175.79]